MKQHYDSWGAPIQLAPLRYVSKSGLELKYATPGSAGLDLPYWDPMMDKLTIYPGFRAKMPTGVHVEIPEGYVGQIDSRSSTSKLLLQLLCHTVDCDYRGEISLVFANVGKEPVTVKRGEFYAQILIVPVEQVDPQMVDSVEELTQTERGDGSFGSTTNKKDGGIPNVQY